MYEHTTVPSASTTVALKLVHPDGATSWYEVSAEPTAVTGLVIAGWYDLNAHGRLVHCPGHYVLTHVPTGAYLSAVTATDRAVLHSIAERLAGLGWNDWSQWTTSEEVPDVIPELYFAVQHEALAAAARK